MKLVIQGRIPSKKNSKSAFVIHGRAMIVGNPAYTKWSKEAANQVIDQKIREIGQHFPIAPQTVRFMLFAPDARKGDLSNKWESVADLLVDCGVFEDDNWEILNDIVLQFGGIDRENPRVELLIE